MKKIKIFAVAAIMAVCAILASACSFRGASAYEIALRNGYSGTEEQWLESLRGPTGNDGKDGQNFNSGFSAYELYEEAVANGSFTGDFSEFIERYFSVENDYDSQAVSKAVFSCVSIYSQYILGTGVSAQIAQSAGSGIIYEIDRQNGNALIITNYHVIYNSDYDIFANSINCYLYGREYSNMNIPCKLVGGSAKYDLALLEVENSSVLKTSTATAASIGNSDDVCLGQSVIAIGNSMSEGISITRGVVSVESETISLSGNNGNKIRVIRHDASVSPGNSGGGLFDSDGNLIGIVNAKIINDEVDNMNYAIPSNTVKGVAQGLKEYCLNTNDKAFYRPYIGLTIQISDSLAYLNEQTNRVEIRETVLVYAVTEGGLSDGKLEVGDKIVSLEVGGKTVTVVRNFQIEDAILGLKEGETITFNVERNGTMIKVPITITKESIVKAD